MKKQKIHPSSILLLTTLITTLVGCTPEPDFKITKVEPQPEPQTQLKSKSEAEDKPKAETKPVAMPEPKPVPQAPEIVNIETFKPIIGNNTFNSTPNLMTYVKSLNVTDADSKLSDLRVFFDGNKLNNKTTIKNSNGSSLEIKCGGDTGAINPLQCQFVVSGKALSNVSETFVTNFHVRDITLNKEGKDISNTSDQGKMLITFSRDALQIDASNTSCNFIINSKEASCDINNFSAFDSINEDILVSVINSEANMQENIKCAKIIVAQKLKIRCTLKLSNDLASYPLSKNFSATFNLTNTSYSKLSMKDSKTVSFAFSRTPIVYTKKQTFQTSSTSQVPGVDILWVVDNSSSMANKQADLVSNFGSFIKTFIPLVDNVRTTPFPFKMSAITTDAYLKSSLCDFEKCSTAGNPVLVNDSLALSDYDLFSNNFSSIVKVGTKGSSSERSIQSLTTYAATIPTAFSANNLLVIIFLSDEVEQSYKTNKACLFDNFTTECNQERVQWSINQIASLKQNKELIKVFSIVDFTTDKGNVYKEISKEFSGSSQSIKTPFSSILTNIGTSITNTFLEYNLSFQGNFKNITSVTVDGKVLLNTKGEDFVFVAPNKVRVLNLPSNAKTMTVEFQYSNEN